jgi:hypothetical protein
MIIGSLVGISGIFIYSEIRRKDLADITLFDVSEIQLSVIYNSTNLEPSNFVRTQENYTQPINGPIHEKAFVTISRLDWVINMSVFIQLQNYAKYLTKVDLMIINFKYNYDLVKSVELIEWQDFQEWDFFNYTKAVYYDDLPELVFWEIEYGSIFDYFEILVYWRT